MELKVEEIQSLAPIKFNYEDVKNWATEKAKQYKSIVYTEETTAEAKSDRAMLNKVAKAINDEKIRVKKEFLKPFEDFEKKCKELQSIITDASNSIDVQVKAFEEKEQNEKKEQIKAVFDAYIGDFKELILFDIIFNPKWLNKTYTMKKIEEEINHLIVKAHDDMGVLDGQIKDENINKTVKAFYFSHITDASVLGDALTYGNGIIETNRKLEELKKSNATKTEEIHTKVDNTTQQTEKEQLQIVDFRVWVTEEQKMQIREFLINNNIKYGKVE